MQPFQDLALEMRGPGEGMGPRCCDVSHLLGLSWICLPPSLG